MIPRTIQIYDNYSQNSHVDIHKLQHDYSKCYVSYYKSSSISLKVKLKLELDKITREFKALNAKPPMIHNLNWTHAQHN